MHQVRIARPIRRTQRRTEPAPLVATPDTCPTRDIDDLLERIEQLLGVS